MKSSRKKAYFSEHFFTAGMVVRDRIKELSKIPVGQVEKTEDGHGRRSPDQDNNLEGENFVIFLYQIEKINSAVEQIKENNRKIKETQKHFFDEPSTAGRERYQDEHKILMKVDISTISVIIMGYLFLSRKIKGWWVGFRTT